MEKFEQFFKENRLRLDTENLETKQWDNIRMAIGKHQRKKLFRQLYAAASILIIIGLFTLLWLTNKPEKEINQQVSIFSNISPDLAKQEISYMQLISNKVDTLKRQEVPIESAELFNEFIQQLKLIDKQYELYKIEIEKQGYNEDLIQQIIYNYQLKLSVLQMLQSEIDKINKLTKKQKNEKDKIKLNI